MCNWFNKKTASSFWIALGILLSLAGCTTPAERIEAEANRYGFSRQLVPGTDFLHVVYLNAQSRSDRKPLSINNKTNNENGKIKPSTSLLHVYIEGDGLPWRRSTEIADDPTPRRALMLRLMARDPTPSVYLGRPCYLGLAKTTPCNPLIWTHARYSKQVVLSMTSALRHLLEGSPKTDLVLLGHSGGGTLALLLAERLETTQAVITLAGNLDVESWAALHQYTPLRGSLNPITRPAFKRRILQRHYVGLQDKHIPPNLTWRYAITHPEAEVIEIHRMDHICCWEDIWPGILDDLEKIVGRAPEKTPH